MHRTATALALTSALVLTAACGGGEEGDGDDRARTIDAPASAEPAELEGDGGKTLSEAELQAALLTVQDVPTGYTLDTAAAEEDDDDSTTEGGSEECSARFEALGEADDKDVSAEAEVSFEGPSLGTVLEQGLESYEDEDVPKQRFEDVLEVLSDCPTFSSTENGETTDFTVSSLSFPKLGDDTIALNLKVKTSEFDAVANLVVVRLGRNVMSVTQGGLTADVAALEQATRKGLEKLTVATG